MGYIPTEWQTGDIITAAKLNKAEEGIAANSPLIVTVTKESDLYVADTEYADACAAIENGQEVKLMYVQAGIGPLPEMRLIYTLKKYVVVSESIDAMYFSTVDLSGGGSLTIIGFEWTSEGISVWPAE